MRLTVNKLKQNGSEVRNLRVDIPALIRDLRDGLPRRLEPGIDVADILWWHNHLGGIYVALGMGILDK